MCVIVYKPKGIELPDENTLRKCWNYNNDGAGVAWIERGWIEIRKGFMEFEELMEFLNKKDWTKKTLILHFRAVSKGAKIPLMTHPFTIQEKNRLVYKTKNMTIFHNGTISGFGNETNSDTYEFTKWLGQLKTMGVTEKALIEIIRRIGYLDKFLVITPKKIYMIGRWYEKNNCYYSNLYWDEEPSLYYWKRSYLKGYGLGSSFNDDWDWDYQYSYGYKWNDKKEDRETEDKEDNEEDRIIKKIYKKFD